MLVSALPALLICFLVVSPVAEAQSQPVTLGSIENLTNSPNASTAPVVAAVNSHVYVAWEEKVAGSQHVTFFQASNNSGMAGSWITNMSFDMVGGASPQTSAVQIAAEGPYVFLTWEQDNQTAYALSADNGTTFQSGIFTMPVSLTGTMSGEAVAACGSYAYFTWADILSSNIHDKPIVFAQVHYSGSVFTIGTPVALSTVYSAHSEDESACSGNYVYVVWDSIYITISSNNGLKWSPAKQISPPGGGLSREPMVSAAGSNLYVTFPSDKTPDGSYQTFVAVSNDNGGHWLNTAAPGTCILGTIGCNPARDLSYGYLSNAREVQVKSTGSYVYITSRGKSLTAAGTQQYVYVSSNNGANFTRPILLGKLPNPENGFGGLAVNGTNVYVQWIHNPPGKAQKGIQQIFMAASQDCGSTFASYQQLSQSTGGTIGYGDPSGGQGPQVAASNGYVYSVWVDLSTNSGDVYFMASTVPA